MAQLALMAIPLLTSAGTYSGLIAAGSTMETLATVAQVGGTILSGIGAVQSLSSGNKQAAAISEAAHVAAGQERAKAQYAAVEQQRQAGLVSSRARAVAGASGGGVTDPTVNNIISGIDTEGEYRAMTAMYEGEDRARGITDQGSADAFSAKQKGHEGFMSGLTNVMSGASSLFTKYSTPTKLEAALAKPNTYQTPFGVRTFQPHTG